MSKSHAVLRFLRKLHLYIGIFTTPALLFFAVTGALQTFSLHETTAGSAYKPPAWIASLAQLHKKQTTAVPPHRARPASQEGPSHDAASHDIASRDAASHDTLREAKAQPSSPNQQKVGETTAPQKRHLPMKIFFLLVSVSLLISTLTGIYMSYRYSRSVWTVAGLLLAGIIAPLLLLPF